MNRCANIFINSIIIPNSIRTTILKWGGVKLGQNVSIAPRFKVNGNNLIIGDNSWIGYDCYISCQEAVVSIGSNVGIASNVRFVTDSHRIGVCEKRCGTNYSNSIQVEDGCWIGTGVIILPGVKIHKGCVIGAGSIVTKNCDADSLYAGNPAIKKKSYG